MHSICKITTLLIVCISLNCQAADTIAELHIKSLSDTVMDLARFTQKTSNNLPLLIAGGWIGFSANKNYSNFDFDKPITAKLFPQTDSNIPVYTIDISSQPLTGKSLIVGGRKLFFRDNESNYTLSPSNSILKEYKQTKPANSNSDIYLELKPARYQKSYPTQYKQLTDLLYKNLCKDQQPENLEKIKNRIEKVQKMIDQLDSVQLFLNVEKNSIGLKSVITPVNSGEFSKKIKELCESGTKVDFSSLNEKEELASINKLSKVAKHFLQSFDISTMTLDQNIYNLIHSIKGSHGTLQFVDDRVEVVLNFSPLTVKQLLPPQMRKPDYKSRP